MTPTGPRPFPKIIAHRGASALAPENTLGAFRRAGELGAKAVEMDVSVSRDGKGVIVHDLDVKRCSDGSGAVVEKTLAELQALDAGGWFSPAFKGERIPTLEQALEEVLAQGMALNLELKPTPGFEEKTVQATFSVLKASWPKDCRLLVSSMNTEALGLFHGHMPDVELALIKDRVPESVVSVLDQHACGSLHCAHASLTDETVAVLHGAGKFIRAYTVNDASRAATLLAMGVDGIFTDHPEQMLALEQAG